MNTERKNIGVTQKAIVFRGDGKFLALRRGETAPSHPLAWDLPGGELEYGEDPINGIVREIREETGLEVSEVEPFDVLSQENPAGFWVTIAYRCKSTTDKVVLSYEHNEYKWVSKEEFLGMVSTSLDKTNPSSEKIIRFVKKL